MQFFLAVDIECTDVNKANYISELHYLLHASIEDLQISYAIYSSIIELPVLL